ncbi:MAG: hypothetical protein ACMUIL_09920 [bacterium]
MMDELAFLDEMHTDNIDKRRAILDKSWSGLFQREEKGRAFHDWFGSD